MTNQTIARTLATVVPGILLFNLPSTAVYPCRQRYFFARLANEMTSLGLYKWPTSAIGADTNAFLQYLSSCVLQTEQTFRTMGFAKRLSPTCGKQTTLGLGHHLTRKSKSVMAPHTKLLLFSLQPSNTIVGGEFPRDACTNYAPADSSPALPRV